MKIQVIYKFKSGEVASSDPIDVYDFKYEGDFLKDMINGKLDNLIWGQSLDKKHIVRYGFLSSVEIKFIEE